MSDTYEPRHVIDVGEQVSPEAVPVDGSAAFTPASGGLIEVDHPETEPLPVQGTGAWSAPDKRWVPPGTEAVHSVVVAFRAQLETLARAAETGMDLQVAADFVSEATHSMLRILAEIAEREGRVLHLPPVETEISAAPPVAYLVGYDLHGPNRNEWRGTDYVYIEREAAEDFFLNVRQAHRPELPWMLYEMWPMSGHPPVTVSAESEDRAPC